MLRLKGKNKLFDEKGVFGRVCRHEFPKGFISIKHGERSVNFCVLEHVHDGMLACKLYQVFDCNTILYFVLSLFYSHLFYSHFVLSLFYSVLQSLFYR